MTTRPTPLSLHRYRDGRISAWLTNYADAIAYWQSVKDRLIEPTLSEPLRTSPSIWRVDYMDKPKELTQWKPTNATTNPNPPAQESPSPKTAPSPTYPPTWNGASADC